MTCANCGATANGNFCSNCGSALGGPRHCVQCGSAARPGALYCNQCGTPIGEKGARPRSAMLPWLLSGLVLAGFSILIAWLVIGQAAPRAEGAPPTGTIDVGEPAVGNGPAAGPTAAPGSGMPTAAELAAMPPRQVADRLYERAMTEHEGGDLERAAFFADMGRQAYGSVPSEEIDADARFHLGMLALLQGDSAAARARADSILTADADHLLGLILAVRVADFTRDSARATRLRARFVDAAARVDTAGRPEYRAHGALIERQLNELSGAGRRPGS